MLSIHHNNSSHALDPVSRRRELDYPLIPFSALTLKVDQFGRQLRALQSELRQVWESSRSWGASPSHTYMNLTDKGFAQIDSSRQLVPAWIEQLNLSGNEELTALPNDFSINLRSLSLVGNTQLKALPAFLPHGLSVDITQSGLSHATIHAWQARRPQSGVSFIDNGVVISAGGSAGRSNAGNANPTRDRANWESRSAHEAPRDGADGADAYQPPAHVQENYDRHRFGAQYANQRMIARTQESELDDTQSAVAGSSADGAQARPSRSPTASRSATTREENIGLGDYQLDSDEETNAALHAALAVQSEEESESDSGASSDEAAAGASNYGDYVFDSDEVDSDEEDEDESSDDETSSQASVSANMRNLGMGDNSDTSSEMSSASQAARSSAYTTHNQAMAETIAHMGQKIAFWLGEEPTPESESATIAQRCVDLIYDVEMENGGKERDPSVVVTEMQERFNDFSLTLDRIKDTASFSSANWETQVRQRKKISDLLRLMVADKTVCATSLAAMKIASTSCPDALATEGIDMVEAMCTTARSIHEDWTPATFYQRMEQQIKYDKVRAQVGEIIKRMKKEYSNELTEVIQRNHAAFAQLFPSPGRSLAAATGERHVVKKNGTIFLKSPDPDEQEIYAATREDRKKYIAIQARKNIDDIEVLTLCQNMMQHKGLMQDVQESLYPATHYDNSFSKKLNVTAAEFKTMSKSLSISRAEIIKRMTIWEPWTDHLDRNGYLEDVSKDPELLRRETELTTQMETLRETLSDLVTNYAADDADAAGDFALLNNLIAIVGTPVVNAHELLRRGGENANAIKASDKAERISKGKERLAELEASQPAPPRLTRTGTGGSTRNSATASASAGAAASAGARTIERSSTSTSERAHRDSGHRHHRRSEHRDSATGQRSSDHRSGRSGHVSTRTRTAERAAAAPPAPAEPVATFEKDRLDLFKTTLAQLKEMGEPPYQEALYRKTKDLVDLYVPEPEPAARPAPRHRRR